MKKLIFVFIFCFLTLGYFDVQANPPKDELYRVTIKTTYEKVLSFKVNDFHVKKAKLTMVNSVDYGFPVRNTVYHDEIVSVEIEPIEGDYSTDKDLKHYLKKLSRKGYIVEFSSESEQINEDILAEI